MSRTKPLTIMLAEDNDDHAELITDTLVEFGIGNNVVHVADGEDAMRYLRRQVPYHSDTTPRPDLVLLDLKMPRLDGLGTLTAIRSDDNLKQLPVIMVSTSSARKEIKACFEAGANSYVTKPLKFEEFVEKIKNLNLYWVAVSELPGKVPVS